MMLYEGKRLMFGDAIRTATAISQASARAFIKFQNKLLHCETPGQERMVALQHPVHYFRYRRAERELLSDADALLQSSVVIAAKSGTMPSTIIITDENVTREAKGQAYSDYTDSLLNKIFWGSTSIGVVATTGVIALINHFSSLNTLAKVISSTILGACSLAVSMTVAAVVYLFTAIGRRTEVFDLDY